VKYAFIHSSLTMYDVTVCGVVLQVSHSGYYQSQKRGSSDRVRRQEELAVKIHAVHEGNLRVYGSPRI
jgi:hypothetical protein